MPLHRCPWMAARCPHYSSDCDDPDSVHCLYVKNTTATARAALQQLLASKRTTAAPDPDLDKTIKDLQDFLAGKGG
jgi:hypothetical protein